MSSTGSYFSDAYIEKVSDKEYRDTYAADQLRLRLAMMIRTLRDQRGLTQADLGKIIDKPQSVISRIEDPDYGKVSLQTILDVAAGFDLPVYIDMPEWDDWFRLMQDFSESGLKRDGFDPDQLRAIENSKPNQTSATTAANRVRTISARGADNVIVIDDFTNKTSNSTRTYESMKVKNYAE